MTNFNLGKPLNTLVADLDYIESEFLDGEMFCEILEEIDNNSDFEISCGGHKYRFIDSEVIDEIQREELTYDEYILGCFNASFLAGLDNMPLDYDTLKVLQESEAFEGIGKLIANNKDLLAELQEDYARTDGYGHHFALYDHNEYEIMAGDRTYYVFRTN